MADGSASIARTRLAEAIGHDRGERAAEARQIAQAAKVKAAAHEGVRRTRQRRIEPDWGSANRIVGMDAKQLRDSARALCRDYDVATSGLNVLVQNTVGSGIDVNPAPRKKGDKVDRKLAQHLRDLWDEWWDAPEVTGQHDFGKCQQLLAAAWFRDGEAFWQQITGPAFGMQHGTAAQFSLELIEADLVPLDLTDPKRGILQGVERNAWGRVNAYHVYKTHPGDMDSFALETKRVSADQMRHLARIDRIHQVRGLSVFASVINRIRDIQDYENSERIAAKVAASYCAQIIKEADAGGASPIADGMGAALDRAYRSLTMVPGMIGDDLLPGEKLEIIDSKRPNPNVATYVDGNLRRVAGGIGTSFSSISLNYLGTYSAQRQELVEKFGAYAMLGEQFVARVVRPIWVAFVQAAVLTGQIRLPAGWTLQELCAAVYIRPQMPWIDPLKEVLAMGERVDRGWMSEQEAIQRGGNDPEEVWRLRQDWAEQQSTEQAGAPTPRKPNTTPDDESEHSAGRRALLAHALETS